MQNFTANCGSETDLLIFHISAWDCCGSEVISQVFKQTEVLLKGHLSVEMWRIIHLRSHPLEIQSSESIQHAWSHLLSNEKIIKCTGFYKVEDCSPAR